MTGQCGNKKEMDSMRYQNLPEAAKYRWDIIQLMAKTDSVYTEMLQRCVELEAKYDAVLNTISTEQMDTICDFLTHCEAMSDRLLELACTYMRFPE